MQNFPEKQKHQAGYIALISTIIISLVLVGLVSLLSYGGYFTRASVANSEYKRISLGLAESCANIALLKIGQKFDYSPAAGGDVVPVGNDATCTIVSVGSGTNRTVVTKASFQGAFSSMSITADVQDPSVVYTPPTTLTVYASGNLPSDFHLNINGGEVASGEQRTLSAGTYIVSETHVGDYTATFGGDCDLSGNITLATGNNYACSVYYQIQPTTANLTVLANIFPSGPVSYLEINNSTGNLQASGTSPSIVAQVLANASYTVSATTPTGYQASTWSGSCEPATGITGNLVAGTNYTCVINFSQPAPACADTVMMLDRTKSMFGYPDYPSGCQQWIPDEKAAAKALLDLYKTVTPHPQVGIGRFADNSQTSANIVAHLTSASDYSSLYSTINSASTLADNSGYTNLGAAISVSNGELNSSYHLLGKEKVLILISDGEPNRPGTGAEVNQTGLDAAINAADTAKSFGGSDGIKTQIYTIHFGDAAGQTFLASLANNSALDHFINSDTDFLSPTNNSTDGGSGWSNPTNAYANGGGAATDNGGHRHRYSNFSFSIPTGAAIDGIEVKADASSTINATDTGFKNPTSNNGNFDNASNAYADGGNAATATNGEVHQYYSYDFSSVPTGATINGIEVRMDAWRTSSHTGSIAVEISWNGGTTWTTTGYSTGALTRNQASYTKGGPTITWGHIWTQAELSNFRIRLAVTTNDYVSLDWLPVKVYYTPSSSGCQLGVDLSWDGGSSSGWSSEKTQNLTNSETTYNLGGGIDKWGTHSWQSSEFSNSNFRVRVHEIGSGCTANLDWLQAKVYYSTVDVAAENADGDNFYISPTSADMKGIFEEIGRKVCPAAGGATQSKMNVITQVINSNGGVGQPGDFHITISGAGASPSSFDGSAAGTTVVVSPATSFDIGVNTSLTNYYPSRYIGCSATGNSVAVGETVFCTIINYDKPPDSTYIPPPPPPANIIINSWVEKP